MFRGKKQQIAETRKRLELATKLCKRIECGDINESKELLEFGADVNLLLPNEAITPFHMAVGSDAGNALPIVELCLLYGANPNVRASEGVTPVHVSAIWGKSEILKILLTNGGNPSLVDEDNQNALDLAVENNQAECIKILIEFEKCKNKRLSLTSLSLGNDTFIIKKLNPNASLIIPKSPIFPQLSCCQLSPNDKSRCSTPAETSFRLRRSASDSLFSRSLSSSFHTFDKQLSQLCPRTSTSGLYSKSLFDIEPEHNSSHTAPKRNSWKKLDFDLENETEDTSSAYVTCNEGISQVTPYSNGLAITKLTNEEEFFSYGSAYSPAEVLSCDPNTKKNVVRLLESPSMCNYESRTIGDFTVITKNSFLKTPEIQYEFLTSSPLESMRVDSDDSVELLRSDFEMRKSKEESSEDFDEYIYIDKDKDIKLIERRFHTSSRSSTDQSIIESSLAAAGHSTVQSWKYFTCDTNDEDDVTSSLDDDVIVTPDIEELNDLELRDRLISLGDKPGPITESTRSVYELRLARLQQYPHKDIKKGSESAVYSRELQLMIEGKQNMTMVKDLEMKLRDIFDSMENANRQWREGRSKSCFNYLLLDPRVTGNLPNRSGHLSQEEQFKIFLASVFYIGKGKRTRPYSHFNEAALLLKQGKNHLKVSNKCQHILNIWADGYGVISLHCFQNVIPVEAYTREACMLDAIGRKNVTNVNNGNVYGAVCRWTGQKRRHLGAYMLLRACNIFLNEGERQIRPADM